jgi:hypothetical protein
MGHADRNPVATMCGNPVVVMGVSLGAMMGVTPADFRVVAGPKAIVVVAMCLVVAMEEMMEIADVVVAAVTAVAMMAVVVEETMVDHLVVAGIWDADAIWVAHVAGARFSRPERSLKAHLMASWNFIHGDMVSSETRNETTRRKTRTRLSPARLLKNTSCDKVSSFEAMSGRAREIRGHDSVKLN